jgi:hypothetical protein
MMQPVMSNWKWLGTGEKDYSMAWRGLWGQKYVAKRGRDLLQIAKWIKKGISPKPQSNCKIQ